MKAFIEKLRDREDLHSSDVSYAVSMLLSEQTPREEKAAFLTALHEKGETAEEITAFVQQLIDRSVDPMIDPKRLPGPLLDVCGTGGAGLGLFNVSTTIMFMLAAGGAVVVKHGNRGVTSASGSADVLEALGVRINCEPDELMKGLSEMGLAFIFARQYHPAFRMIAEIREQLAYAKTRTIFNLLGPLLNPARPPRQLIGVYEARLTTVFAEVLRRLKRERAWVVHGSTDGGAGMDNISISGATTLAELENGKVTSAVLDTRWLGVTGASVAELRGGDATENAATLLGILGGELQGPKRDLALVNAAGGFVVSGLVHDLGDGIALARETIESGRAMQKLRALQQLSA
ncbi:MAG: anthranilate phosphoribosyltransferase [Chthoniobacterales bacterium]|nr:anthranilate phosphoribosyltransferase [Chthoniobacterales bacterium]